MGTPVQINKKGLRGAEVPYAKDKNRYRILYLGDSITFGFMIADESKIFPDLVEKALQKKLKRAVETVNAGVCGYSLDQEYLYLQKEGKKYQPDLVVVSVVLNDITDKIFAEKAGQDFHQDFGLVSSPQSGKSLWMYSRLAVFSRWMYRNLTQRKDFFSTNKAFYTAPDSPRFRQYLNEAHGELDEIIHFCQQNSLDLIVLLFPCSGQLQEPATTPTPQYLLSEHLRKTNTRHLDFTPLFREKLQQDECIEEYFIDFWHPTEKGHRFIAARLEAFIDREKFVK